MSKTTKIIIAAMGGEGGGVLCKWLTAVGEAHGCGVHYTYVPGAAQRTGATVYYLEIHKPDSNGNTKRPVSTLIPSPGDIDLVLSTEIVEAGRCLQRGFITKNKTTVITSTHRTYAIAEKSAPGDGRIDHEAVEKSVQEFAKNYIGFDMSEVAKTAGSIINSVLLGAAAASDVLNFPKETYKEVLAAGVAADSNISGFCVGRRMADESDSVNTTDKSEIQNKKSQINIGNNYPEAVRDIIAEGRKRTSAYQNKKYMNLYVARVEEILNLEKTLGMDGADYKLTQEVARWLIRLMCFDDVVRVADIKTRKSRLQRVKSMVGINDSQLIYLQDFLKPRAEEIAGIFPDWLAKPFLTLVKNTSLAKHGIPLKLSVHTVSGFIALRLLASLKFMRPFSTRFNQEQDRIDEWLKVVKSTAQANYNMAVELASSARLIKGYGPTYCQSVENFNTVLAVGPSLTDAAELAKLKNSVLAEEKGMALKRELT